jgi:hypothetical protein
MATDREYDPPAMTEEERLGKRRFEAYFAFETQNWAKLNPEQFHPSRLRRNEGGS